MSFKNRLSSNEFIVLAEMDTPKGVDISELITNSRRVIGRADAVIIPDMDNGIMRMSALAGGVLMKQEAIEPIIHICGRDRNQMALQGDLLAAHVLGIDTLIVVHGEDISHGDHRKAKPVDDLDELGILKAIRSLENGLDLAGFELKGRPSFTTGCEIPPYEDDKALDVELERAQKKVEAGAQFVITPAVFDMDEFTSFMDKAQVLNAPIIPTVFLLKSVGMARYMVVNEPGAHISEQTIRRIRKAPDREMECLRIAAEIIKELKYLVQGVKVQTLGWEHRLPEILDLAGL